MIQVIFFQAFAQWKLLYNIYALEDECWTWKYKNVINDVLSLLMD
jgi:hypothetical protein